MRKGKSIVSGSQGPPPGNDNKSLPVMVIGRNCLREVLKHAPQRLKQVLVARYKGQRPEQGYAQLLASLEEHKIPVEFLDHEELSRRVNSYSHQSFAALLEPRVVPDWKSYLEDLGADEKEQAIVLALDAVTDPQNLGAILRTAECFAVDAVIWSKNRTAPLSPSVSKASAGASELLNCFELSNLSEGLRRLKSRNFWLVAAEAGLEAVPLEEFEFPAKCALVMGSEGEGISRLVQSLADYHVRISLFGKISSLNVSQAAAIMLHAYRSRFPCR